MKMHYDNDFLSDIKNLIQKGFFDIAEEKINEYKLLYPKDIIINKYHSKLMLKRGLFKEAETLCLDVLNRSFHVKRLKSDMYITLSEALQAQNKIEEAIQALEKAYELKDQNTQTIQIRLANLYLKNNEKQKAFQILDKSKNNAFNKNIELEKAYIYIREKEEEKALKILLDINDHDLKSKIDIQKKNMYLGNIYKKNNEFEKALLYYKNVLLIKNDYYWHAYCCIGHIKYKLGFIDEAIIMLDEALKKYENDLVLETLIKCYLLKGDNNNANKLIDRLTSAYLKQLYLGRIELNSKNYEKAEEILSDLFKCNDAMEQRSIRHTYYYLIISKFRLNKYDEVLELINNNDIDLGVGSKYIRELALIEFYAKSKLGYDVTISTYSERQAIDYSEELAIEHIKNHHDTYYTISKFSNDINIESLYHHIKNHLDEDKKIIMGMLDKYIFDFTNDIGNDKVRNLRTISVICLPNTNNILTMYPDKYERLIVQESSETKKEKPKVKRLSQIEKFNKKYNK